MALLGSSSTFFAGSRPSFSALEGTASPGFLLGKASSTGPAPTQAISAERQNYRGFKLNVSADASPQLVAAVHRQVDRVLSAGLPDRALTLARSIPIMVIGQQGRSPGAFTGQAVKLNQNLLYHDSDPVLLHELMHLYHQRGLPGGASNETVKSAYARAKQMPVFAQSSHMMSNAGEYFATTATAYLTGTTVQEPFSRQKLVEAQPKYASFLAQLFGQR